MTDDHDGNGKPLEPNSRLDREEHVSRAIAQARDGSDSALGWLLGECRDYLLLVANRELPDDVRQKLGASDLVQETLTEAYQAFVRFGGGTEEEMLAWLRRILLHNVADAVERFRHTAKRDLAREVPVDGDGSQDGVVVRLVDPQPTPQAHCLAGERKTALLDALQKMPEHYRQVIMLRNLEYCSLTEIGRQMALSADAARKLWERAIRQLATELKCDDI